MKMKMKVNALRSFLSSVVMVCALVAMAGPAEAQSVSECKTRIDYVQLDLDSIYNGALNGIGGNNRDLTYTSLTSKLQGAKAKLDQHKFADAKQKLQDFKDAVILMRDAAKPKLSKEAAALLLDGSGTDDMHEGVNGALACVILLP